MIMIFLNSVLAEKTLRARENNFEGFLIRLVKIYDDIKIFFSNATDIFQA